MGVSFSDLQIGGQYTRTLLAELWGYRDWHALARGAFTPAKTNYIVLFITEEKQESLLQYDDGFDGTVLRIDGEKGHRSDLRLANSKSSDEVHLFYRRRHHLPFTYHGEVVLESCELLRGDKPSRFIFRVKEIAAVTAA